MFPDQFLFGVEVLLNGLMAGVLYALVALGFVLIFQSLGHFQLCARGYGFVRGADPCGHYGRSGAVFPFNQRDFWHGCASFRLARSCLCGHSFGDGR
jgi:hypothetical protein